MKIWSFALTWSVLTALVFAPKEFQAPNVDKAQLNERDDSLATIALAMPSRTPANLPARSPITAIGTAQKPLRGVRICIDPGHGGESRYRKTHYTGGTVGVVTGQTEGDVNLRVSLMLRQYLEAAGAEIVMTRESDDRCTNGTDKLPELDFRTNYANARGADLLISVHHNDAGRSPANYGAVFYPSGTVHSISLAENIAKSLHNHMGVPTVGAKAGKYRVLDRAKMPAVIVEASFMTNPDEDRRLANLAYNKLEAKAIATGIMNYIRLTKGREVDFNTIFAPIDQQAGSAQMLADASFVRRDIVEKKSLFGTVYEEITYDARGGIASRREIGRTKSVAEKTKETARKSVSSSKATAKKTVSKARKATASVSKKAASASKRSNSSSKKRS